MSRTATLTFKNARARLAFSVMYHARAGRSWTADAYGDDSGRQHFAGDDADRAADISNEIPDITCSYISDPE